MQKKRTTKPVAKARPRKKAPPAEKKQPGLKRLLFGEEKPDLTELESGSTTILDILSPTAVDTKSRDYIYRGLVQCSPGEPGDKASGGSAGPVCHRLSLRHGRTE